MNKQILLEDVQQFAEHFELWEQLKGKVFLITGATGLIGSVMIKCLIELNLRKDLNVKIFAIIRNQKKAKSIFEEEYSQVEFLQIPLTEITHEKMGVDVDYIIHLASPTASKFFVENPVETLRTAIEGTTAVLEYAKEAKVKGVVYASSLESYGSNQTDKWIKEDFQGYVNPTDVRSSYNIGKRVCECLCHSYAKEYDVNVMIGRLTQTFGAGISDNENRVFAQFARSAIKNEDIVLHTEGKSAKPYCYTTDTVGAILYLLLNGKKGEAYNIANKESYISIRDMAQMVRDEFNTNIRVVLNANDNLGYAPMTRLRLNTNKIESLGWKSKYDLKKMYERTLSYLKDV